jgi:hypothetical protein
MISGTLVLLGLVLRRTPWENRITLVLLVMLSIALLSLSGDAHVSQYVAMAWPGVLVVGGIWLTGLLIGQKITGNGTPEPTAVVVPLNTLPAVNVAAASVASSIEPTPSLMTDGKTPLTPETESPASEDNHSSDDETGGGK